jgi:MAF protein
VENHQNQPALILASSSPYRRELLSRLQLPFRCLSPAVDETALENEDAAALVMRLSERKARKVAESHPAAIVIGSDQVAVLNERILTKPGGHAQALLQLQQLAGQEVIFMTGLCVFNAASGAVQLDCMPYTVRFRALATDEIERYLQTEKPYDCAGSFKSEGLGVSLLEKMSGDDPATLIGLPLIRLCQMLRNEGIALP